VHFTGQISDAELIDWVQHAVALVIPSFYEGFGIPPLEAMAVGCPVAVADIPALRETCGDAAIYFDPFVPE
ncbi:MAG TPA: glycosyltransferase, partial [Hyphomicrobium sp.]|nr:glycosyltransferase [Hyphomicrobium sp.]